jgi:hypothetical protein
MMIHIGSSARPRPDSGGNGIVPKQAPQVEPAAEAKASSRKGEFVHGVRLEGLIVEANHEEPAVAIVKRESGFDNLGYSLRLCWVDPPLQFDV